MVKCIIEGIYADKSKEYIAKVIACKIPIILLEDLEEKD